MEKDERQRLIDICFEIGIAISARSRNMTTGERAEWIARQLRLLGYDTEPCGASWGVLK
jgi:hypothetical protein